LSQGFTEFFLGVHTIPRQRKSQGWIQRFDQGSFFSPLFSIKAVIVPDFLLDVKHFFRFFALLRVNSPLPVSKQSARGVRLENALPCLRLRTRPVG
jgi:hypothetical protein